MSSLLTLSSFIFPLITFPYVSRILLPVGTGKVSFATSVIAYFALFARMGIPTYGVRACARVRDNKDELSKTVQEILIINLVTCTISYTAFFLILFHTPRLLQEKKLFLILSTTLVFESIGIEWMYKSLERYEYITKRSIFFKFIALVLMLLLVKSESDYVIYGGLTVFAASASNVCNLINSRKYITYRRFHHYQFRKHLGPILVFFAMSCATTIYTNLDTTMLGFMKTNTEVGYYNAAVKIKQILLSIVTSLGVVLLPRSSYYIQKGLKREFFGITAKAITFVFLISIPLTIYFIIFAKEGIYFLSGTNYAGSIVPMQIIMPTIILIGLTNIMGTQTLVPLGKEKIVLFSEVTGAIFNIIANFIMIPILGVAGAALSTLFAEILVWIVQFSFIKSDIWQCYRQVSIGKIVLATVCALACSIPFKYIALDPFMTLLCSGSIFFVVYFSILLLLKVSMVVQIKDELLLSLKKRIPHPDDK